jgi:hypothetical protein
MKMAKLLGYQVATNTTIYKETDMTEIEQMFDFLSDLGVDDRRSDQRRDLWRLAPIRRSLWH